jgi:hypothetical protein
MQRNPVDTKGAMPVPSENSRIIEPAQSPKAAKVTRARLRAIQSTNAPAGVCVNTVTKPGAASPTLIAAIAGGMRIAAIAMIPCATATAAKVTVDQEQTARAKDRRISEVSG